MSFFNDAQRNGLLTGRYICSECGGLMEFEDEGEDTLSDQRSNLRRLIKTISKGEGVLTRALSLFFL